MRNLARWVVVVLLASAILVPFDGSDASTETVYLAPFEEGRACVSVGYALEQDPNTGAIRNRRYNACVSDTDAFEPYPGIATSPHPLAIGPRAGHLFLGCCDRFYGYNFGIAADLYTYGVWRADAISYYEPPAPGLLSVTAHITGTVFATYERWVKTCLVVYQQTNTVSDCFENGLYTSNDGIRDLVISNFAVSTGPVTVDVYAERSNDVGLTNLFLTDIVFSFS